MNRLAAIIYAAALVTSFVAATHPVLATAYEVAPENSQFKATGVLTAEVPNQQKIDCFITMSGHTVAGRPAVIDSTTLASSPDGTCGTAEMGRGVIELRAYTALRGEMSHFKVFMPRSGTDCGMGVSLPFTLDVGGYFKVWNVKVPSQVGPCTVLVLIPFKDIYIEPRK